MIILTTLYNAQYFIGKCIKSLQEQSFKDWTCYILDDMSTDNSVNIVKQLIENDERFVLIRNDKKLYQGGNYDQIIRHSDFSDDEVCVEVDGDDWLPHSGVLDRINHIYQDKNIWITNGSFIYPNAIIGFSSRQNLDNLRQQQFTASHLRTWRVGLWNRIKPEDLKDSNGNYYKVTGDLSFMYPMLEMAGPEHYYFVPEIMYTYNDLNPLNDHKVDINSVISIANKIRNKEPYARII